MTIDFVNPGIFETSEGSAESPKGVLSVVGNQGQEREEEHYQLEMPEIFGKERNFEECLMAIFGKLHS